MLRATIVSSAIAAATHAQPIYTPILFEGDQVPGWTDQTVGWRGGNPFLFHVMTPGGDVLFRTQHNESNVRHHLLRFDAHAAHTLVHAASGRQIAGADAELVGPVVADTTAEGPAVFAASILFDDGAAANALLHQHGAELRAIAHGRVPVPVHGVVFGGFNSDPFIMADANAAGDAIIKARFSLDDNEHHGVYRAARGADLARVIDSTQPVPGHPSRAWSRATNWTTPFEPRNVILTPSGEAYFRAWFTGDDGPEMLLLRSGVDGSLEPLVDSAAREHVPGRTDDAPLLGVVQLAHGGGEGVLLTASTRGSGYTGSNAGGTDVLLATPGEPLRSVWSSQHATIPGRPDLRVELYGGQEGAAINAAGNAVVSSFVHHDSGGFGRVLVSIDPAGQARLVADGNNLPGQHPEASARAFTQVDINERGQVAFHADIADQFGGDALFCWHPHDGGLTRVLQSGMEIDGRSVLEFSFSSSSAGQPAGDRFLSENGAISASVHLAPGPFDDQQWALVHILVPAPGSLAGLALALAAPRKRR